MPSINLTLRTRKPLDLGVTPGTSTLNRTGRDLYRRVLNALAGALSGSDGDYALAYASTEPATANAALALASSSDSVGGTINGVTVTATWATSDTVSAGLIAAAINASSDPLVLGYARASNLRMTATLASVAAGTEVVVCGSRFTAVSSSTIPNVVSGAAYGQFDISGNDTADALSLANAINAAPGVSRFVFAIPVAAVVYIFAKQFTEASGVFSWPTGPGVPPNLVTASASTVTLSGASLVASVNVGIFCPQPTFMGNAITIAASGTNVSSLGSQTRFLRGTGSAVVATTSQA